MEAKIIINNTDFSPWIVEDGLEFSDIYRQSRDVTVLNGTLFRAQVKKLEIGISLVELRDSTLALLETALTSPATVQYSLTNGQTVTKTFYVSGYSRGVKTVKGGNSYYSGVKFDLEEK